MLNDGRATPVATLDRSVLLDGDVVRILDRRVFPARVEWVTARTPAEVAEAIRDMVTQSSGPLYAACAGLELAAMQASALPIDAARAALAAAAGMLASARPTNAHPRDAAARVVEAVSSATSTSELVQIAIDEARAAAREYRDAGRRLGRATVALLPDEATVLTHCWMDAYLFGVVEAAEESGSRIDWIATETRPYLQGARLTAHSLRELGQRVTLITDGMAAAALSSPTGAGGEAIDAVVTAADRVSLDGCVVNKVGTLGIAAAAAAFDVPYYALVEAPDPHAPTGADITIEARDPVEVLEVLGRRTASELVTDAWYPAFDLTPAHLVTRIVTKRGAFPPDRAADHFAADPDAWAAPLPRRPGAGHPRNQEAPA